MGSGKHWSNGWFGRHWLLDLLLVHAIWWSDDTEHLQGTRPIIIETWHGTATENCTALWSCSLVRARRSMLVVSSRKRQRENCKIISLRQIPSRMYHMVCSFEIASRNSFLMIPGDPRPTIPHFHIIHTKESHRGRRKNWSARFDTRVLLCEVLRVRFALITMKNRTTFPVGRWFAGHTKKGTFYPSDFQSWNFFTNSNRWLKVQR